MRGTRARPGGRSIAVVGSGVSGLAAAHVLQRAGDDVTLFEADTRLGGHAHTHDVADTDGAPLGVDSGFIVHNRRTYPLLVRLFDELGVETRPCGMSLSVSCAGCGLEYAGARGVRGLFATPRNLAKPAYLRMLSEIPRFHRAARALLADAAPGAGAVALGTFVRDGGYSAYFTAHFITPLVAAVWSCPPETAMAYPARSLFAFLANHGMLSVGGSPQWYTVAGGSRSYVDRVAKNLTAVRTGTPVESLRRAAGGVRIDAGGARHRFDGAVVATHADQALRLLHRPTTAEREVLGAFRYSRNTAVLHTDPGGLPRARSARAAWNYRMARCSDTADAVRVSYDMNRLQGLDARRDFVVSLNAADEVRPEHVLAAMTYEHPVYTAESLSAQRRLPELGDGVLAFAGAHHGWGFHEDGCRSGVAAARALGADW
ncbi:putative NAD/FAD-binding protein [Murinocardiopsis flavida]|uniref:Putative NAD/FAD-binding protein n=1 Tax=Murinocardiopsis flavida TaxID=645275 RepID=A0A2P8CPN7_9ACTN|nr:FAD-dependent oxidoreductase [Murinocardiopsis flavida]PSK86919.1 putative NAD/FAD-binding protein [Murinocardiopsis flavida]